MVEGFGPATSVYIFVNASGGGFEGINAYWFRTTGFLILCLQPWAVGIAYDNRLREGLSHSVTSLHFELYGKGRTPYVSSNILHILPPFPVSFFRNLPRGK